ncbi:hypothetical protein EZS27_034439 [termite gut metagenome]|uniref:DDE Tnp4 domain-containing protein n=1 Tax=termite gut metagenome TaxID=433724 RepID=A0A5J4Q1Y1_9ZZZZ
MPARKPRGRDLSRTQKQQNKEISSFRVKVEHAIGRVRYSVLSKNATAAINYFLTIWFLKLLVDYIISE